MNNRAASRNDRPILLVEDDRDDEELTIMSLRKAGITNEIVVTRDEAETLEKVFAWASDGAQPRLPVVTLLDLKLPKLDGLQVLERIRADERTQMMPVVVLTSSVEQEDLVASYQLGTNAYVRKPVEFDNFVDAVSALGLFWLLVNVPPPVAPPANSAAVKPGRR